MEWTACATAPWLEGGERRDMAQEEPAELARSSRRPAEVLGLFLKSSGRQLMVLSSSDMIRFVFTKAESGCTVAKHSGSVCGLVPLLWRD